MARWSEAALWRKSREGKRHCKCMNYKAENPVAESCSAKRRLRFRLQGGVSEATWHSSCIKARDDAQNSHVFGGTDQGVWVACPLLQLPVHPRAGSVHTNYNKGRSVSQFGSCMTPTTRVRGANTERLRSTRKEVLRLTRSLKRFGPFLHS